MMKLDVSPVRQVQEKLRDTVLEPVLERGEALKQLEPPSEGVAGLCWRLFDKVRKERLGLVAAGVTFYVILALFPALSALVSIYGLMADPVSISVQLVSLSDVLPGPAISILRTQLDGLLAAPHSSLGLNFLLSMAVAFWSINNAMKAIIDGLNHVYDEEETRGFVELNWLSFRFALGGVFVVILYLVAIAVVPLVLTFVGLSGVTESLIKMTRWPLLIAVSTVAIGALTRYGPARAKPKWYWVTPGGVFVVLAWVGMSWAFSFYLANFAHYDKTYGSLGAAIGLMMWIWLSTFILLVGAGVNSEAEVVRKVLKRRRKAKK